MTPAFKEWFAVVNSLAAGATSVILRKGGIAEDQGGFAIAAHRFWLLPTRFHAQAEKLQPRASPYLPTDDTPLTLFAWAELTRHHFLTDTALLPALRPYHLWGDDTVTDRFHWSQPAGLHVLVVRVHRLVEPVLLDPAQVPGGCTSWVGLPFAPEDHPARPAIDDATHHECLHAVLTALGIH